MSEQLTPFAKSTISVFLTADIGDPVVIMILVLVAVEQNKRIHNNVIILSGLAGNNGDYVPQTLFLVNPDSIGIAVRSNLKVTAEARAEVMAEARAKARASKCYYVVRSLFSI